MKANEDLSGPYESWSTAPPPPRKKRDLRVRAAVVVVCGLAILLGAIAGMVMVSSGLAPVWRQWSGWFFVGPLILALLGMTLVHLATRNHWHPRLVMLNVGMVLTLSLGLAPLVPLFLYLNQSFDSSAPVCAAYEVASKEKRRLTRGGVSHHVSFSRDGQVVATVHVSSQQFAWLSEGHVAWVEVADGLFGIQYVNQIYPSEQGCAAMAQAI